MSRAEQLTQCCHCLRIFRDFRTVRCFPQVSAEAMYCFQAEARISAKLRKFCAKNTQVQLKTLARKISQTRASAAARLTVFIILKWTCVRYPSDRWNPYNVKAAGAVDGDFLFL